ncbi:MAG: HD-GYP domain-containing protein, partial [Eubacteriales bacterium]
DGKEDIYKTLTAAEDRMYRQKLSESKETKKAILASLQATLESRGVDTKEHSLRLVAATAKVGSALGLGKSETEELALLSRLHDIGKIMVDENILKKPGRLTESEYIEVQKHSEAGYRIAQSSTELIRISEYILSHHERWDGKGYPQGLKGEEIPFLSRVFSIADAYDAMTNDTHYRKAMGKTEAFEEIKRCAGTQFDPKLAGVFISALSGDEES